MSRFLLFPCLIFCDIGFESTNYCRIIVIGYCHVTCRKQREKIHHLWWGERQLSVYSVHMKPTKHEFWMRDEIIIYLSIYFRDHCVKIPSTLSEILNEEKHNSVRLTPCIYELITPLWTESFSVFDEFKRIRK